MTQFTWNCRQVDAYPTYESETDVVYNVHWVLLGVREDGEENYSSSVYGTQSISLEDMADFIPFEDLTNEIVVGWVESAMGEESVQSLKDSVDLAIDSQINPTSVTLTIPN